MRVSSLPGVALLAIAAGSPLMAAGAPQGSPERVVVEVGTVSVRPVTVRSWIPGSIVSRADARTRFWDAVREGQREAEAHCSKRNP